jgi:catechol 2,3-dioxygenase-like lactoylglutathione lyase family enzyme
MSKLNGQGIAHVTLTVSDIKKTKAFYEELFKVSLKPDNPKSFSLLSVGIPCWFTQWESGDKDDRFDESRVGLDHVAFRLKTLDELEMVVSGLEAMGVTTAGVERFAGKYPYVAFRDPDNIQTEFFINEEI